MAEDVTEVSEQFESVIWEGASGAGAFFCRSS
jgi:hypothetical protein